MQEAINVGINRVPQAGVDALGHIYAVTGSQAKAALFNASFRGLESEYTTVGKFLKICCGQHVLVGLVTEITAERAAIPAGFDTEHSGVARICLMGELELQEAGTVRFRRGVRHHPVIGDTIHTLRADELRMIYAGRPDSLGFGKLHQNIEVDVCLDRDEFFSKHFAVLGSTGVGKSSAVAYLIRQVMRARPEMRVFLLDAHNEYHTCFSDSAFVVTLNNLRLPFWLFSFDEFVDVVFGGRPGFQDELEVLAELIPVAKANYSANSSGVARKSAGLRYTPDTPVPYRLADLISLIDERMGKLENRSNRMMYHKLITRLEAVSNDPRYIFMFENANVGGDTMAESISQLFRLPVDGRPVTIMQLAGFPAEVVDAVVSVVARLAFEFGLWSEGADPVLFVCEEAHKYAPADRNAGFAPTRRAISRLAKEGRKYGVYLGIVTQRPAEIDPTIISQCGSIIAMRMSNDRDQELLKSAVADTAANLLDFVPVLGTREALIFGVGTPLPTRVVINEMEREALPASEALDCSGPENNARNMNYIASVIERWRKATMPRSSKMGDVPGLEHGTVPLVPQGDTDQLDTAPFAASRVTTPQFGGAMRSQSPLLRSSPKR